MNYPKWSNNFAVAFKKRCNGILYNKHKFNTFYFLIFFCIIKWYIYARWIKRNTFFSYFFTIIINTLLLKAIYFKISVCNKRKKTLYKEKDFYDTCIIKATLSCKSCLEKKTSKSNFYDVVGMHYIIKQCESLSFLVAFLNYENAL